jgi:hypothetical protein
MGSKKRVKTVAMMTAAGELRMLFMGRKKNEIKRERD